MNVKFDGYKSCNKEAGYITDPVIDWNWTTDTDSLNAQTLADFYAAVDWLLNQKWDEYTELASNTINPAQQNAFIPLREYRVKRNGHYRNIKIFGRVLGGCYIAIS